jgi:hypothetical protein
MSLPTLPAHQLAERPRERRRLIDQLRGDEAVGIVGGEPKSCKSFLALGMAVSVAGGVPCLGSFAPVQTGRVLLYAVEDALHVVRQRLAGIAAAAGRDLADLDIHVITAPSVRLDVERDRDALVETVVELRPKLLVPDPFVRLHRIDENISGEVAPLLAYLRELQRRICAAASSRTASRACAVSAVTARSLWRSAASDEESVRAARRDAWQIPPPIWWIAYCRTHPTGSGCSRCPSCCASCWRAIRRGRAGLATWSCARSARGSGASRASAKSARR